MSDYNKKRKKWLIEMIAKTREPKIQLVAVKQLRKLEASAK